MILIESFKIDYQNVTHKVNTKYCRAKKVTVLKVLLWGHLRKELDELL